MLSEYKEPAQGQRHFDEKRFRISRKMIGLAKERMISA